MNVLVCGSRGWSKVAPIHQELSKLPKDTTIIEGGANGADTIAGKVALKIGLDLVIFMANWTKYGKVAGPIRNGKMLAWCKVDRVLAFTENPPTRGTQNMIDQATKAGIEVRVFTE